MYNIYTKYVYEDDDDEPSGFDTWKFSAKKHLNQQKQVFLRNCRPWPAQEPKIWSIFYGKKFI